MVYIITGKVNRGKTAKLLNIYRMFQKGDGFYNKKIYIKDSYAGQKIVRLSTGESQYLSFKAGFIPPDWDEKYRYDVYSFSENGVIFAEHIIDDVIQKGLEPIFIDEIGPLELRGEGFSNLFTLAIKTKKNIYVVIRENCLQDIIKEFNIKRFQIIRVSS